MRENVERVAWIAVASGFLISALFGRRIPIYPLAVSLTLPVAAAVSYVAIRSVARRTLPPHLYGAAHTIAAHLAVFVVAIHALVVANLAGLGWARALGPRGIVVLLGAFLITTGNVLPRVRPNLAIGIRTRRLLADPQRWARMHRCAGYNGVAVGGAVCLAGVFLSGPAIGAVVSLAVLASAASLTVAYWRVTHD